MAARTTQGKMGTADRQVRKIVVPAAGLGTRLAPLTRAMAKEMLPLGRKPVIQRVIDEALEAGLSQCLIITSQAKRLIEDHLDACFEGSVALHYRRQREQQGLGHAVLLAEEFMGEEPFAIALGDAVIQSDAGTSLLREMAELHLAAGAAATIAVEEVAAHEVSSYGIVTPLEDTGASFRIRDIVEKPEPGSAPSRLAVAARYVFSPAVFEALRATAPGRSGEIQLTDAVRVLLREGLPVWCLRLGADRKRFDVGGFAGFYEAFAYFAVRDTECGGAFGEHLRRLFRDNTPAAPGTQR